MKKLRLDIEELVVESFEAERAQEVRGTVRGHWPYTYYCNTAEAECTGGRGASCYATHCDGTCHSCVETEQLTCVFEECV